MFQIMKTIVILSYIIIWCYLGIRNQNPFYFSFSGNVSANFGCTYKCPNFIDRHLKLTPGLIFFLCMSLQCFFLIPLKWCGIICGISIGTWEVPRCREVYITCLEMFHGPSLSFGSHTKGVTKIKKAPLSQITKSIDSHTKGVTKRRYH